MKNKIHIQLDNLSVDFPIYTAASHSLKNRLLHAITYGHALRPDENPRVVKGLNNINLTLIEGDRVGLIGHNGAGKTTLLRVLSGIYHPTQGKIISQGRCVSLINIGLGIDPEATGRQNIYLRGIMMGLRPEEIKKHTDAIIDFSELDKVIDRPFRTYSSGMQMRLAFAVSTAIHPEILIIDEWLAVGDEAFQRKAEQRLNTMIDSSQILILASHSKELITKNCNRILWMEAGQIRNDPNPIEAYFLDK